MPSAFTDTGTEEGEVRVSRHSVNSFQGTDRHLN